jgi:hypothetical protein
MVTGVDDGGTYLLGDPVSPACVATDPAGSGVGSCEGTLQSPGTATGVGTYLYTATATDAAGNTATRSITYQVVYAFGGFEPPVGDGGTFEIGQTIPVKFRLRDDAGHSVHGAAFTVTVNGAPAATNGSPDGHGKYHVNVATSGLPAGSAVIAVVLDDGTTHQVSVELVAKPDKGKKDKGDKGDDRQGKGDDGHGGGHDVSGRGSGAADHVDGGSGSHGNGAGGSDDEIGSRSWYGPVGSGDEHYGGGSSGADDHSSHGTSDGHENDGGSAGAGYGAH